MQNFLKALGRAPLPPSPKHPAMGLCAPSLALPRVPEHWGTDFKDQGLQRLWTGQEVEESWLRRISPNRSHGKIRGTEAVARPWKWSMSHFPGTILTYNDAPVSTLFLCTKMSVHVSCFLFGKIHRHFSHSNSFSIFPQFHSATEKRESPPYKRQNLAQMSLSASLLCHWPAPGPLDTLRCRVAGESKNLALKPLPQADVLSVGKETEGRAPRVLHAPETGLVEGWKWMKSPSQEGQKADNGWVQTWKSLLRVKGQI